MMREMISRMIGKIGRRFRNLGRTVKEVLSFQWPGKRISFRFLRLRKGEGVSEGTVPDLRENLDRPVSNLSAQKSINSLIVIASIVLGIYLLADILELNRKYLRTDLDLTRIGSNRVSEEDLDLTESGFLRSGELKPFSHYESVIRRRNIFQATPAMARETAAPAKRPIRLGELAANLSVNGIFLDRNPQALILDKKANKTHFVTEGQYISDILIRKIEKGKVILAYKGEEMELVF